MDSMCLDLDFFSIFSDNSVLTLECLLPFGFMTDAVGVRSVTGCLEFCLCPFVISLILLCYVH